MDRLACVDLPALPLQLLLRRHPDWRDAPAAVVAEDKPLAPVLLVNRAALAEGVRPGLSYAQGLSRCAELRADTVPSATVERRVKELVTLLGRFSPGVEACPGEAGVFWLDASGLGRLYPEAAGGGLRRWGAEVLAALTHEGLRGRLAVGFSRFGSYGLVRARAPRAGEGSAGWVRVCSSPSEERRLGGAVPLQRLGLPPRRVFALERLGVGDLGALVALPGAGLLERFGPEVYRLHALARGELWDPLQPTAVTRPARTTVVLEPPETNLERLLFRLKRALDRLLRLLRRRHQALAALRLSGTGRGVPPWTVELRPAAPTLDGRQLLELLRLRLERQELGEGVAELELRAMQVVDQRPEQLELFAEEPPRDLEAVNRALARLRAELGEEAVLVAELLPRHLPEAQFCWRPLRALALPRPAEPPEEGPRRLRRLFSPPRPLPGDAARPPPGELLAGPHVVSGGWWGGGSERHYYYQRAPQGPLRWIYWDARRGRWFCQGEVQ